MTSSTYEPNRIARACGMTPVSLRAYHGFGLKSEGPVTGEGVAKRRHYTQTDAVAAAVMHRLIQRGVSRQHAAGIANDSRRYFAGRFWLAVFPGMALGWHGSNTPLDLAKLLTGRCPDGTMPTEIIVLAVHEIAAALFQKLDEPAE